MKTSGIFAIIAAIIFSGTSPADEIKVKPLFGICETNILSFGVMGGVDGMEIVPGASSMAFLSLGGGYLQSASWRDAEDERLSPRDDGFMDKSVFWTWQARARLGMNLGILRSAALKRNILSLDLFYKSDFQKNVDNGAFIFQGSEANRLGFWENSFFAALNYDNVAFDQDTALKSGLAGNASIEWAPGWDWNQVFGRSDYGRVSANLSAYMPLLKSRQACIYLGERLVGDALFGSEIPYDRRILMNVGPVAWLISYPGTGYILRGVEPGRFDAKLKLVNNFDIRLTLPGIFGRVCIPEIVAFFDVGFWDDAAIQSPSGLDNALSTGLGLFLNFTIPQLFGAQDVPILCGYVAGYNIRDEHFLLTNFSLGSRYSF